MEERWPYRFLPFVQGEYRFLGGLSMVEQVKGIEEIQSEHRKWESDHSEWQAAIDEWRQDYKKFVEAIRTINLYWTYSELPSEA